MKNQKRSKVYKMILSAMMLALAIVLPFLSAQLKEIGNALCLMHIPVLLCGFICGPLWGFLVGLCAPLLRSALFTMPNMLPNAVGMAAELATYGLISGLLYMLFPKKKGYTYVSLISAMIVGRVVWGITRFVLLGIGNYEFTMKLFIAGALTNAIPGIILQIILIPILVMILDKRNFKSNNKN